jgi:hypothetical protein
MEVPPVHYATTVGGLSIGYQRIGSADIDVVCLPGAVSHLEMAWDLAVFRHLMGDWMAANTCLICDVACATGARSVRRLATVSRQSRHVSSQMQARDDR